MKHNHLCHFCRRRLPAECLRLVLRGRVQKWACSDCPSRSAPSTKQSSVRRTPVGGVVGGYRILARVGCAGGEQ